MNDTQDVLEQWVTCPRFNKYEVSNLGRFRNKRTGQIMVKTPNCRTGRLFVRLSRDEKVGKNWATSIYSAGLIAEAFLGPKPPGTEIDHVTGDKTKESIVDGDLEYVSKSVNIQRSYKSGLRTDSTRIPQRHLTPEEYELIFKLAEEGVYQTDIGRRLGRCNSTVSKVLSGKIKCRVRVPQKPTRTRQRLELIRSLRAANPGMTDAEVGVVVGVSRRSVVRYKKLIRSGE